MSKKPADSLVAALGGIQWSGNVATFVQKPNETERLAERNMRLAIWSRQIEQAEKGNPALGFVREMQVSGQLVTALTALALYKPAAAAIRTTIETALYYSYFRRHPVELQTLIRTSSFYISKSEVIEYHKTHTASFKSLQAHLGLLQRLEESYSSLSAIVHGQVPGTWSHHSLKATAPSLSLEAEVIQAFEGAEDVVHRLFLCTLAQECWSDFSAAAKASLLKGLSADTRTHLALDAA